MTQGLATPLVASTASSITTVILVPVLVAALTAAATLVITRAGQAADRRRDHYADAMRTLVAWIEFPYRIRRRTNDNPETLAGLASLGADLQERLAWHQTWIATEHPDLASVYRSTREGISASVRPAAVEAWSSGPITAPEAMNLGDWGPAPECEQLLIDLQHAIEGRFGFSCLKAWRVASRARRN